MGSVVSSLFGNREKSTTRQTFRAPRNFSVRGSGGGALRAKSRGNKTDVSVVTPSLIDALRDESLGLTRGIIGDVQGDIESLRALENPFVRARVRPVEANFERLRDDTRRAFGRRSIFGSTLRGELSGLAEAEGRAVGDAAAQAEFEVLNAIQGRQEQLRALSGELSQAGVLALQRALAELGLSRDAVSQVIRSTEPVDSRTTEARDNDASGFGNLLFALGGG